MKRYIIAAISILAFAASMVSCTDHEVIRQLDDVEAYINEHPDSALSVLDSLSTTGIQGREANAKFALLYSIALDKSYIDATDDSLINIAVDWHRKHGTAGERLKSYYYQGRVYQNSGTTKPRWEFRKGGSLCRAIRRQDCSRIIISLPCQIYQWTYSTWIKSSNTVRC